MKFLNISVLGLGGRNHPVLNNIITTHEVEKMRPVVKMLSGDYLTYSTKAIQTDCSPHCRLCLDPFEDIEHVVFFCIKLDLVRNEQIEKLKSFLTSNNINTSFLSDSFLMTQFVLDCSSLNLGENRISNNNPILEQIFVLCRNLVYGVHKQRLVQLRELQKEAKVSSQI